MSSNLFYFKQHRSPVASGMLQVCYLSAVCNAKGQVFQNILGKVIVYISCGELSLLVHCSQNSVYYIASDRKIILTQLAHLLSDRFLKQRQEQAHHQLRVRSVSCLRKERQAVLLVVPTYILKYLRAYNSIIGTAITGSALFFWRRF